MPATMNVDDELRNLVESEARRQSILNPNAPTHIVAGRIYDNVRGAILERQDTHMLGVFNQRFDAEKLMPIVEDLQSAFC